MDIGNSLTNIRDDIHNLCTTHFPLHRQYTVLLILRRIVKQWTTGLIASSEEYYCVVGWVEGMYFCVIRKEQE